MTEISSIVIKDSLHNCLVTHCLHQSVICGYRSSLWPPQL